MKGKKLFPVFLIFPLLLSLCGFSFYIVSVLVDTEQNHVYEYATADEILNDFAKDIVAAEAEYKGGYYYVSGKTVSISKTGDILKISGTSATDRQIICSCPMKMRAEALKYPVESGIGVFGKITVDLIDKEVHIEVERLTAAPSAVKSGTYYLRDGTSIDKNSMSKRTLNNGKVTYYIPAGWKGIEHSIVEEEIGTMEGYQYVLNRLPGNKDTVPESFFVCYFDNASKLENMDDRTEIALIEKAIINNISGEGMADSARTKDVTTYYGARYNYYETSYKDALNAGSNGYHVEYIFQRNLDQGYVIYIYIYKEAKHLSDVMFVTRFLEIASG